MDSEKLSEANLLLKKELADPAIELLNWIDNVGGIIPKKSVHKIPFFSTDEIKEINPWRVCPIGEHWVRRHDRQKKHLEDVDGHCRKNKSKKDQLKGDEIDLISNHHLFKNPKLKVTPNNLGFKEEGKNGNQFDDLINGWVAYWNDIFKTDPPLHPNFIKALMATESGFNNESINKSNNKKTGPARGLLQITERAQRQLSGDEKELKDHLVILDDEEVWGPNKNICAGVRWLFRKREILKSKIKGEPTWREVLMGYKGKIDSQTNETKKVLFKYSTWRDDYTDFGRGATLCDYSFNVIDAAGIHQIYVARRAKELIDCRELFREWKNVRKNSKYTCLLGEPASYENKEKGWIWGKTKTKNGCMSYFLDECDSEKKLKEYEKEK